MTATSGPADRRPFRQIDQVGRRAAAGDLGDRLQFVERQHVVGIEGDDPPTDAAAVQVDPDEVADTQLTGLGNSIIELLVQARDVRQHTGDEHRAIFAFMSRSVPRTRD